MLQLAQRKEAEEGKIYIEKQLNIVQIGTAQGTLENLLDEGTVLDGVDLQKITNPKPGIHYYNKTDNKFYIGTDKGTLDLIFEEN